MRYSKIHVLSAVVRGVYLGIPEGHEGYPESKEEAFVVATLEGLPGDRHFGLAKPSGSREKSRYPKGTEMRNTRQVSILSIEDLAVIAEQLNIPRIEPEWLGANLLLEGIPSLSKLPPGTHLAFPSGAAIVVDDESEPCHITAAAVGRHAGTDAERRFVKASMGYRGVNAWIERVGGIATNDAVAVTFPTHAFDRMHAWFPQALEEEPAHV